MIGNQRLKAAEGAVVRMFPRDTLVPDSVDQKRGIGTAGRRLQADS